MEPFRLDAVDALNLIRSGELTASALVASCLERIHEREPLIRAFAYLDRDGALQQAKACDASAYRAGLAGLPVGIKDICDTTDLPTCYGSPLYAGHRPTRDAACVAALRRAGAVIMGKTATAEFAGPHPAPTRNPRNLAFSPGGSSAGSAAAVADFMVPFAVGTQTAGSIIRPAAFCGIVGLKPSFRLIDTSGVRPAAPSFDTVGTFGRTVRDAALLLAILAGDPSLVLDRTAVFRPRIGLCRTPEWAQADDDIQMALEAAGDLFSRAGAYVRELVLPPAFARAVEYQTIVMAVETLRTTADDIARGRELLSREILAAAQRGSEVSPDQEREARAGLDACRAEFEGDRNDIDVLICPSAAGEAPEGLSSTGDPVFNRVWTALGVPCLTLSHATGDRGMPIGVQVVGRPRQDRRTIAAAIWMEQVAGRI